MNRAIHIFFIAVFVLTTSIISCKTADKKSTPVWSELPGAARLDSFQHTDFSLTLESPVTENKNAIYAPSFLIAWDKIREALNSPIKVSDSNSVDFRLLNNSVSHHKALADSEYIANVQIVEGVIFAEAFFNKTLPFETQYQLPDTAMNFGTEKVESFGIYYYFEELVRNTHILYYQDDEHFVLKLAPKDKTHEIILAKGIGNYKTLAEGLQMTNNLIRKGKEEQAKASRAWMYQFLEGDVCSVPSVKFNIGTNYRYLQRQVFYTQDNKRHVIDKAYQRTGFLLNENGAVVESYAAAAVDTASPEPVITRPKKLYLDKPFLIVVKHTDRVNPYFVMKVANTELLIRK